MSKARTTFSFLSTSILATFAPFRSFASFGTTILVPVLVRSASGSMPREDPHRCGNALRAARSGLNRRACRALPFLEIIGYLLDERTLHVLLRDGVAVEDGLGISLDEGLPNLVVELPISFNPWAASYAAKAWETFDPRRPSIRPGENCARSSSTWSFTMMGVRSAFLRAWWENVAPLTASSVRPFDKAA